MSEKGVVLNNSLLLLYLLIIENTNIIRIIAKKSGVDLKVNSVLNNVKVNPVYM